MTVLGRGVSADGTEMRTQAGTGGTQLVVLQRGIRTQSGEATRSRRHRLEWFSKKPRITANRNLPPPNMPSGVLILSRLLRNADSERTFDPPITRLKKFRQRHPEEGSLTPASEQRGRSRRGGTWHGPPAELPCVPVSRWLSKNLLTTCLLLLYL